MAAQDAQLQLKVSLDLTTLRRQLATVGTELSGQALTVPIKFDRTSVVNQFRLLNRYIGNKKFNVEINTNLKTEIDRANKLVDALGRVQRAASGAREVLPIGTIQLSKTASQKNGFSATQIKTLFKAAIQGGLLDKTIVAKTREQMVASLGTIGRDAMQGLLNGLSSGDARLKAAAESLGESLISALKTALGIASPSKETKKLGEFAAEGFVLGFVNSAVKGERQLAASTRKMLRAVAMATKQGSDEIVGVLYEIFDRVPGLGRAMEPFRKDLTKAIKGAYAKALREGMSGSILPGIKGGVLGAIGGGAFGVGTGAIKGLYSAVEGATSRPGREVAASVGRLMVGNTSEMTAYIQSASADIVEKIFSTGTLGAIIGGAAVAGVAGASGFIKSAFASVIRQIIEAIINKITRDIYSVLSGEYFVSAGKGLQGIVQALIRDANKNQHAVSFPPMLPALPPAYRGIKPAAEPAGFLPPAYRGLPGAPAPSLLSAGAEPSIAGLLPSATKRGSISRNVQALIELGGPSFGEEPPGKLAIKPPDKLAMNAETLKRRVDAILAEYFKGVEEKFREVFDGPVLKKALIVFSYLVQAIQDAEKRTRGLLGSFGRERTYTGRLAVDPQVSARRITGALPSTEMLDARKFASAIQKAIIVDMQNALATQMSGRLLPAAGETRLLPAAGETRGLQRMMEGTPTFRAPDIPPPSLPPGGPPLPPPSGGSFFGGGGMKQFGAALGGAPLPGAGIVKEIGNEFAFAAKQVLLYGSAYKAIAFIQGFPAQVGQAVSQLQSFNNTLKAISPSAQEAAASNEFILSTVDKYNVPLQSARDGFAKLYASMQPAGFGGDEIRDLFLGISKAAATFGMSSDKVDRVTYAFAQMASKGQVMSEELKGQLGDVLPGALGIFAEAAGFKGKGAIEKFSKALEDGAYKGDAMRKLLNNVTIELNKEFGPGAEGAARTFQGVMNRMQNSTKLFYEAFGPVAVGFLNQVVVPITGGIKTITDGFNAFFKGTQAKTAGGAAFAAQLQALKPSFEGVIANIKSVLPLLAQFGQIALGVGKILLQIAGNPIVGYLARLYLTILPLSLALNMVRNAFVNLSATVMSANGAVLLGTQRFTAFRAIMQTTGLTAHQTAIGLRVVATAVGALGRVGLLLGITALIERFFMLKSAVDGVRQSTQSMLQNISSMANSGAIRDLKNVGKNIQKEISTFEGLQPFVSGPGSRKLTSQAAKTMESLGMGSLIGKDVFGGSYVKDFVTASSIIEERLKSLRKTAASVKEKLPLAEKVAAQMAQQAKPGAIEAAATEETGKAKASSLESYYGLQDQLAKNFTQEEINRAQAIHDHKVAMTKAYYDLEEARANSYQKATIQFFRQIDEIRLEQVGAMLQAANAVKQAQGSVAGGAMTGAGTAPQLNPDPFYTPPGSPKVGDYVGGAGPARKVPASEKRDIVAAQQTEIALRQENLTTTQAQEKAQAAFNLALQTYMNAIFNVAEQELQNKLLERRTQLLLQGVPDDVIDQEIELERVQSQVSDSIAKAKEKITEAQKAVKNKKITQEQANKTEQFYNAIIKELNELLTKSTKIIKDNTKAKRDNAAATKIKTLKEEIALLRAIDDEEARRIKLRQEGVPEDEISEIISLEKTKENLAKTRQLIDGFVTDTVSDYKGFLKAVISGEDAVDALEKFQQGLKDRVLTIFLDFAMAPVENVLKQIFGKLFTDIFVPKGSQEGIAQEQQPSQTVPEAMDKNTTSTDRNTEAVDKLTNALSGAGDNATKSFADQPIFDFGSSADEASYAYDQYGGTGSTSAGADTSASEASGAFAGLSTSIDGAAESATAATPNLTSFTNSLSNVSTDTSKATEGVKKETANFKESLGKTVQGIGIAAGTIMGIAAGIQQIGKGDTASVIGGIGSILASVGGGILGFGKLFGWAGFANGGIAAGGWQSLPVQAFASGGMVNGPTLGLVGEGRYNEAIVPLPNGRSIPVQLQGGSVRDKMASGINSSPMVPMLSMSFETTSINGTEYVSREQLEAAMMETRRMAVKEGSNRGANLALDRIQQNPNVRKRIGMR